FLMPRPPPRAPLFPYTTLFRSPDWDKVRGPLEALIDPSLREALHGETDSERCFLLFLSQLRRRCSPDEADAESAAVALAETAAAVRQIAAEASTTFLATDGRVM